MITLQLASTNDFSIIEQLAKKIWFHHYPNIISLSQLNYFLYRFYSHEQMLRQAQAGQCFYLIYNELVPIGFLGITDLNNGIIFINKFYIDTEQQHKNYGSQVFPLIFNQYPHAKKMQLAVNRKNYKSINFYFKNGFIIHSVADFDIDGKYEMNDFVMEKNI